jgi:hypothetical protein
VGGGTLSVCGLFTVQYFPIRAFSTTDEDVGFIVEQGNQFFSVALLATAIASPVVICLWAAVLFIVGMVDYIVESDLGGFRYRIFAAVPVCFGIVTVIMTLILGETIDRRMRHRVGFVVGNIQVGSLTDEVLLPAVLSTRTDYEREKEVIITALGSVKFPIRYRFV